MGCAQTIESRTINEYINLSKCTQVAQIFYEPVNFLWMDPYSINQKPFLLTVQKTYNAIFCNTIKELVSIILFQPKKYYRVILTGNIQEDACRSLQDISNIMHIYIFSENAKNLQILKINYPKIKFITAEQSEFQSKIAEYYKINNTLREGSRFITTTIEKAVINKHQINLLLFLNLTDTKKAKQDFIQLAEILYRSNKEMDLKSFDQTYPLQLNIQVVLQWYNRNTFYSKLLNHLIKLTYDLSQLGYIRLPFCHMFLVIKALYKKQKIQKIYFYKMIKLNPEQLNIMNENIGKNLQLLEFMSVTKNRYESDSDSLKNAILIIKVPRLRSQQNDYGYADMSKICQVGKQQMIFNPLNIFYVKKIEKNKKNKNGLLRIYMRYGPFSKKLAKIKKKFKENIKLIGDFYKLKNLVQFNPKSKMTYQYIWLDSNSQESEAAFYKRFTERYPAILCKTVDEVKKIISKYDQKLFCIITNVESAEDICIKFQDTKNVIFIYIFCHDILLKGQILKFKFSKVKAVINTLNNLYQSIQNQPKKDKNAIPYLARLNNQNNVDVLKNRYNLYSLLLMQNRKRAKEDFIKIAQVLYSEQSGGISKFAKQYTLDAKPEQVISWYIRNSFYNKIINTFIKSPDPLQSAYIRLPVVDVFQSIRSLYQVQKSFHFEVYRGGKIEPQELKFLKENVGKLVEVLGFLSTNRNIKSAQKNAVNLMLIIKITSEKRSKFIDYGYLDTVKLNKLDLEQEVIINAFNVFKIQKVETSNGFSTITLKYGQLARIFQKLKNKDILTQQEIIQLTQYKNERKKMKRLMKNQGDALYLCQNYQGAIQYNKQFIEIFRINGMDNTKEVAKLYNQIGLNYKQKGQNQNALNSFLKSSIIFESTVGQQHSFTATTYNNIGNIYKIKKQFDKALQYYLKAFKIRLATFGKNHPLTANSYNNIASIYFQKKQYQKSLEYGIQGLIIQINTLGQNHIQTAQTYNDIGLTYQSKGQFNKALKYFQDSLRTRLNLLGRNNPLVANSYSNIAQAYKNKGDTQKSLEYFLKSLKINKSSIKANQEVAGNYNNLGLIYRQKGQSDKALQYLLEALKLYKKVLPDNHPSIATVYNNLGQVYRAKNLFDTSFQYFQNALKIFLVVYGQQNDSTATLYNNIASVYYSQGYLQKAEEKYTKGLEIRLKILGQNHLQTAQSYNNLGEVYRLMKKVNEAEAAYKKSLAIKLNILNAQHSSIAITYFNLGLLYKQNGKQYEGFEYFSKCYEIRLKIYDQNHKDTILAYSHMREFLDKKAKEKK